MAKQLVPNTARFNCVLRYTGPTTDPSVEAMNTFYVREPALAWNAARLTAAATTIGNAYAQFWGPYAHTTWTFDRVDYSDESVDPGITGTVEFNTAGTKVGQVYTTMAAVLVKLTGESGGIPRRGRLFIPGLAEVDVHGNTIEAAVVTDVEEGIEAVYQDINSTGDGLVIVSRYDKDLIDLPDNPRGRRVTAITNPIADISVSARIAAQRDRRT